MKITIITWGFRRRTSPLQYMPLPSALPSVFAQHVIPRIARFETHTWAQTCRTRTAGGGSAGSVGTAGRGVLQAKKKEA